jgi:hypothetical protein
VVQTKITYIFKKLFCARPNHHRKRHEYTGKEDGPAQRQKTFLENIAETFPLKTYWANRLHLTVLEPSIESEIELASSPPVDEIQVEHKGNTDDQEEREDPSVEDGEEDDDDDDEDGDEEEEEEEETIEVEQTPRRRGRQTITVAPITRGRRSGSGAAKPRGRGRGRPRGRPRGRAAVDDDRSRENSQPIVTSPTTPGDDEDEDDEVEEVLCTETQN